MKARINTVLYKIVRKFQCSRYNFHQICFHTFRVVLPYVLSWLWCIDFALFSTNLTRCVIVWVLVGTQGTFPLHRCYKVGWTLERARCLWPFCSGITWREAWWRFRGYAFLANALCPVVQCYFAHVHREYVTVLPLFSCDCALRFVIKINPQEVVLFAGVVCPWMADASVSVSLVRRQKSRLNILIPNRLYNELLPVFPPHFNQCHHLMELVGDIVWIRNIWFQIIAYENKL